MTAASSRAWFSASIGDFLQTQPDTVVGRLATNSDFTLLLTQKDACLAQIGFLQAHLVGPSGSLFLRFNIPRMGRRIDTVLLIGPVVFVIEFKVGESAFERAAVDQMWDHALHLKNFHEASHSVSIVPILLATGATKSAPFNLRADDDKVYRPILVRPTGFREATDVALRTVTGEVLDDRHWSGAPYHPHLPSSKPPWLLMLSTRSKRSHVTMRGRRTCASLHLALKNLWMRRERKDSNSFVSLRVYPERAKHWSG